MSLETLTIAFWAAWLLVFAAFLVWGLWVLLWDAPRRRRAVVQRLESLLKK